MLLVCEKVICVVLIQVLEVGYVQFKVGKFVIDVVIVLFIVLEDDLLFNVGCGLVFIYVGMLEMDVVIMDGYMLCVGLVVVVLDVKNFIVLVCVVMEYMLYVMLVGVGVEVFVQVQGVVCEKLEYFCIEECWQQLQQVLKEDVVGQLYVDGDIVWYFGMVGVVVLDVYGYFVVGIFIGGMNDKMFGWVGDLLIIGVGMYVNVGCVVLGMGWGEFYMCMVVVYVICMWVMQLCVFIVCVVVEVINQEIFVMGGSGGVIVLDDWGYIVILFNIYGMFCGWIDGQGQLYVVIYGDEDDGIGELLLVLVLDDVVFDVGLQSG